MSEQMPYIEETPSRRFALREGEPSVIAAFVAVAVIWTGFVLAVGLAAGAVRELMIARHG